MRFRTKYSIRRVLAGVLISIIFAVIVTAFSVVWLFWFVGTILSVAIYRWKRLPETGRKVTAWAIALTLVMVMAFTGAVPKHFNPGSAAASRLPGISSMVSNPPAVYSVANIPPQLDELQQAKDEFNLVDFRLRSQSNAVERALALSDAANRAADYGQHAQLQVTDLLDAKQSLDRALDERKLRTIDRLDEAKTVLNKFLDKYESEIGGAKEGSSARRVLTDFRLQIHDNSMDTVNDSVLRLEAALNRIGKDVIGNQLKVESYNRVRLSEGDNTLDREELISFITKNIAIKSIDASELMIGRGEDVVRQDLYVFFGDDESAEQKPTNPGDIPIRPGISKVTIVKHTVVKAYLSDLATPLRVFPFKYFLLKWATLFPAKVRLLLDLSSAHLSAAYPYSVDANVDAAIKDLSLPSDSLFNASVVYKPPRREGDRDLYETDSPLMPGYFLTHNYIWIELMPDSIYFRNKPVQEWKQYLFPENLVAALAVMLLGAIGAAVIGSGLKE